MRRGRVSQLRKSIFAISAGWLFADLLFALAMLFLLSNTLGVAKAFVPTPTPTLIVTPTPTPGGLLLEKQRVNLTFSISNPDALSQGDAQAQAELAAKIRQEITNKGLQNRRAGLAIAYSGAPSIGQIQEALAIAKQVYKALDKLGSQKFVFCQVLHYDPLYLLGDNLQTISIDIYFFVASIESCQQLS